MLYSHEGKFPTLLPQKLRSWSEEDLLTEGWVQAPQKPHPVPGIFVEWDGENWTTRGPTTQETMDEYAKLRSIRDEILSGTDKYVLIAYENGEPVPSAIVEYRQALRDLPENTTDPFNPVFPNLNDEDEI